MQVKFEKKNNEGEIKYLNALNPCKQLCVVDTFKQKIQLFI